MPLDEVLKERITGVLAFDEMPVDAEIWSRSHERHLRHTYLHGMAQHRPGIVHGCEVMVHPSESGKVIVAPGVLVDPKGRTMLVTKLWTFDLSNQGTYYIYAEYSESLDSRYQVAVGNEKKEWLLVEGCEVSHAKELPAGPYIELARIQRTKGEKPIRMPGDPFDPGPDELNFLYRRQAFPYCVADGLIGELSYSPKDPKATWKPNRSGIAALINACNASGFHIGFGGPVTVATLRSNPPLVLYMAGSSDFEDLSKDLIDEVKAYVKGGGTLLIEPAGSDSAFNTSAKALVAKLGAKPAKVVNGEPILLAHYVFPDAPSGANDKGSFELDDENGVMLSSANYGGLWKGEMVGKDADLAREKSKRAIDFGANILAYAALRRRRAELAALVK